MLAFGGDLLIRGAVFRLSFHALTPQAFRDRNESIITG